MCYIRFHLRSFSSSRPVWFPSCGLVYLQLRCDRASLIAGCMRSCIAHPASFVQAMRIAALTHAANWWCFGIGHHPWQDQRLRHAAIGQVFDLSISGMDDVPLVVMLNGFGV